LTAVIAVGITGRLGLLFNVLTSHVAVTLIVFLVVRARWNYVEMTSDASGYQVLWQMAFLHLK
jgi:hypothetical protein